MTNDPACCNLESVVNWQVETLRATFFPVSIEKVRTSLWEKFFQEPPEASLSRPKEGLYQDEGPFENGKLIIAARPHRIDLIYTVNVDNPDDFPTLGTLDANELRFTNLVKQYLDGSNLIKRLALGAVLLYPSESREDAYTKISHCLPNMALDTANAEDFFYQINRPRLIDLLETNLTINRLSRWSVMRVQRLQVQVNATEKNNAKLFPHEGAYACRLELDVNTAPKNVAELPQEKLSSIFERLLELAKEIAAKGDIK